MPAKLRLIRTIGKESARLGKAFMIVNRWQPILCRQLCQSRSMSGDHWGAQDEQPLRTTLFDRLKRVIQLARYQHFDNFKLQTQRPTDIPYGLDLTYGCTFIPQHRDPRHFGLNLFQQFKPLAAEFACLKGEPSNISAGPSQADNEPALNDIVHASHNDRDQSCRFLCGANSCGTVGYDNVNLEVDQLSR